MGIRYDFFKSVNKDRALSADRFAGRFRSFISDGVIVQDAALLATELEVSANDTDMDISIAIGAINIQGYFAEVFSAETLIVPVADATNDRIDRVIMEANIDDTDLTEGRKINLKILEGTPGAIPAAPTLTQDLTGSSKYQLSLAQILVPANATLILDSNVTDERSGAFCGVANINLKINPAVSGSATTISFDDSAEAYIVGADVQAALESVDDELVIIGDLKSAIVEAVSILSASWVDDTAASGYFYYDYSNTNIKADDVVNVNFYLASLEDAADVLSVTDSSAGSVRLYANAAPIANLSADIIILKGIVI